MKKKDVVDNHNPLIRTESAVFFQDFIEAVGWQRVGITDSNAPSIAFFAKAFNIIDCFVTYNPDSGAASQDRKINEKLDKRFIAQGDKQRMMAG